MKVVMLAPAPNTYNYLSRQGNDGGWNEGGSGICTQEYNSLHSYSNVVSPIPHLQLSYKLLRQRTDRTTSIYQRSGPELVPTTLWRI